MPFPLPFASLNLTHSLPQVQGEEGQACLSRPALRRRGGTSPFPTPRLIIIHQEELPAGQLDDQEELEDPRPEDLPMSHERFSLPAIVTSEPSGPTAVFSSPSNPQLRVQIDDRRADLPRSVCSSSIVLLPLTRPDFRPPIDRPNQPEAFQVAARSSSHAPWSSWWSERAAALLCVTALVSSSYLSSPHAQDSPSPPRPDRCTPG